MNLIPDTGQVWQQKTLAFDCLYFRQFFTHGFDIIAVFSQDMYIQKVVQKSRTVDLHKELFYMALKIDKSDLTCDGRERINITTKWKEYGAL